VLLDTNALFMPFQMRFDVEAEIERVMGRSRIAVPEVVLAEITAMQGSVKDGPAALQFARRFETVPSEGLGDDAVVECAVRTGGVVVTGDRGLIKRLRAKGLKVLRPRQRKRLEIR
jgi:rRNA-processing protein FCF1